MMKALRLHAAAILEAEAAVLFYEQRSESLGSEFKAELRRDVSEWLKTHCNTPGSPRGVAVVACEHFPSA